MQGIGVYCLLVVVGVAGAIGDAALNQWAKSSRIGWLLASCVIWIGVATLFGLVLKWERFTFSAAVILALVVHSVVAVAFDRLYFSGRLSGWEWAGIVFAFAAVVFIEIGRASGPDSGPGSRAAPRVVNANEARTPAASHQS